MQVSGSAQNIQDTIRSNLTDNHLDQDEYENLKDMVNQSNELSDSAKEGVLEFLDEARDKSDGWMFGLFGKGLSSRELASLDSLAQSMGDNPVLSDLNLGVEHARTEVSQQSNNETSTFLESVFEPIGDFLSDLFGNHVIETTHRDHDHSHTEHSHESSHAQSTPIRPQSSSQNEHSRPVSSTEETSQTPQYTPISTPSGSAVNGNRAPDFTFENFYVTQNGNGLASGGGDCGPAAAAMVMKAFGELQGVSNRDAVQTMRRGSGVTSARNGGHWAISEAEIEQSVERMSQGRIQETAHEQFSGNQRTEFMTFLQEQLNNNAVPIIEVGSPYSGRGRHYMVVSEIKPNGNLIVNDPGGKRQWEMTPQRLQELMDKADNRGGSHIMAFTRAEDV